MAWRRVVPRLMMVLVLLICAPGVGMAGERGVSPQLQRPLDIPTERLERPRPEQERAQRDLQKPLLYHAEVIGLAKGAAKKKLGKSFDDYDLKAVVFDPTARTWSVTFDPRPSLRASEACLIVFVQDQTKQTDTARCS